MDERLRELERDWQRTQDGAVGARLLHALRLPAGEVLRHDLFAHESVRRAYTQLVGDQPLGELVRAQLDLQRDELSSDDRSRFTVRETELLEAHWKEWTGDRAERQRWVKRVGDPDEDRTSFGPIVGEDDRWELRGGRLVPFPRAVLAADLAARGAAALGAGPTPPVVVHGMYEATAVHEIRLRHLQRGFPADAALAVARSPALASIEELHLWSYNLGDDHTARLLSSPHLTRLRSLDVMCLRQAQAALRPLLDPRFATLRRLRFGRVDDQDGGSRLDDDVARMLAQAPSLAGVEELAIPFAALGPDGAMALVASETLGRLRRLDLSENFSIDAACAERMAREPLLSRLRSLDVSATAIGGGGVRALLSSPHARTIQVMCLGWPSRADGHLAEDMSQDLPEDIDLPDLRELDLSGWSLDSACVRRLARARLPRLRSLSLQSARLPEKAFATLVASPMFARLERLDLTDCDLGDDDVAALGDSPSLRELRLGSQLDARLTGAGLASVGRHRSLNVLDLSATYHLGEREALARRLVAAPGLERLTTIAVPVEDAASRTLRERWGDRVVVPEHDPVLEQLAR